MAKLERLQALVDNDLRVFSKLCFEQMEPLQPASSSGEQGGEGTYRVESLDRFENYRISGIVGGAQPSEYSESPDLWHPFFRAIRVEGAFFCFDIAKEKGLDEFIEAFYAVDGALELTVTDPYKGDAYSALIRRGKDIQFSQRAKDLGAVNHIIYDEKRGQIQALNTDGIGMVSAIQRYVVLKAREIVLIGAGASGSSIGYECVLAGGDLVIADRVPNHSRELAERLAGYSAAGARIKAVDLEANRLACKG